MPLTALLQTLARLVGPTQVLTEAAEQAPYLTDWRGRYRGKALAVVRPGSTEEVAAVVRACAQIGVPMVPQGGNTGLCGGATADDSGRAVVIALGRLNRIRAVDAFNNTLTLEAGCTLQAAQAAAAEQDRLFPLSLASEGTCQIGGNLSSNAGGVHVLRYGNARELTLGLEVVLPDGCVWNGLRGLRKDNTGYDLKQLYIGAEGTLGLITAAVLKLFPLPKSRSVAWVALDAPQQALALLSRVRGQCGERLVAFELISRPTLDLVLKNIPAARDPLAAPAPWYVLFELSDADAHADWAVVMEDVLGCAIDAGEAIDAVVSTSEAQCAALWALRENASEAQRIEGISIKHDVSVPIGRIPEFLDRAGRALTQLVPGVRIVTFGHLGDGNLHYNCSCAGAADNAALLGRQADVNQCVHDLVHALGGSISAEHGLGQLKRDEIERYKAPLELELMRRIKTALDPQGLMNPGKVLNLP